MLFLQIYTLEAIEARRLALLFAGTVVSARIRTKAGIFKKKLIVLQVYKP